MKSAPAVALWSLSLGVAWGQSVDVETHVTALAAETMEGRLTGTDGASRAADYLVSELKRLGLRPIPGQSDFRLPFPFTAGVKDMGSTFSIGDWAAPASGLRGMSFSDTGEVSGEVVFAGYGITVPESQSFGYDSYHGLDVEGKIVLVLRYFPEDASADVKSVLARYSGLRFKALGARERGAKGLLVVTGPRSPNAGELVGMSFDTAAAGSGIVAASITSEVADKLLAPSGKILSDVQKELDTANPHVSGFALENVEVKLDVRLERETKTGSNVAGIIPGKDLDRFVVLGAHFDHLGRGGDGNSLARKDEAGKVHAGADDNASGVSAVLSIAERLRNVELSSSVAVAFWSGEELGLLGSTDFVRSQAIPTEKIVAYVNFDMVGRMRDNKLVLQAVGTSPVWPRLVEQTNVPIGFDIELSEDPYLPTDVTSFNQASIPSINFFTGSHSEYHRPADRPELINYDDLGRVVDFGTLLARKLSELNERPEFVKVARKQQSGGSRDTLRAFTGTIPDYTTEVDGLLLSGVIEGGPAEEAGLQAGDVIVEMAGQKITNIYDYTFALDVVKVGEPVTVVFLRDGERQETKLTPRARE
ncbi:MAG TPA: M20/M25/M40 family metallo-hydrolase [Vicinamibacteria bacterium]|nr:M20/M25/M40 family metallo-hydrolase [Vicinamibacteria bacterium]